ncbi:MAG: glycoside hydrolase family 3 C-terminal domain-containing protein [Clostridia bacterium]|nr:glycoside hydrolase family 3 C-terminal domain-containing protein [Clostridia bacterium]
MAKKKMSNKVFLAIFVPIIAIVLVILIVANSLCFTKFYGILTTYFDGGEKVSGGTGDTYYKANAKDHDSAIAVSQDYIKTVQGEGTVLLKNENFLPMKGSKKVTLFGYDAIDFMYGGAGSGGLSTRYYRKNLKEVLEEDGFTVNETVWNRLKNSGVSRDNSNGVGQLAGLTEIPASEYASVRSSYTNYNDAAIVVFGRSGAEGSDLPRTGEKHFLELTDTEIGVLQEACTNFENVIVIINSAATMELGFLNDYSQIKAALYVGLTGDTGLEIIGDIINGTITPSGHTVDTFAYDLTTAPSYVNEVNQYSGKAGSFVEYEEGIYVGYRWYETADEEKFWDSEYAKNKWGITNGYDDVVQFPFGFGLSYTKFEWSDPIWTVGEKGGEISVKVTVKNTGTEKGKDVVQLYYSAPYDPAEGIEKSSVVLGGFVKTPELAPEESKQVEIKMNYDDLASYDYITEKAYVLSSGDYTLSLRTDAHRIKAGENMTHEFNVSDKIVYNGENKRAGDLQTATNLFDDAANNLTYLSRADFAGTMPVAPASNTAAPAGMDTSSFTYDTYADATMPTQGVTPEGGTLMLIELKGKSIDDPLWETYLSQLSVTQLVNLVSYGGYKTQAISALGKPPTIDLDGPAGFGAFFTNSVYGSGCCSEVVVAATWNIDIAEQIGKNIGEEGITGGYHGWYAPGVNIHRSPFGGRNFEYYSEDGLLSGKIASAVIQGCAEKGVYCYVKHFALNDQESNRLGLITWANEQSMRELYFKPFEIAVKEGKTTAIMSSFNRIGSVWAGGCRPLLTDVLRNEWGFVGMVITDYVESDSIMDTDQALSAGGDIQLSTTGSKPSDQSSAKSIKAMRVAAKNIFYTVVNSHAMNGFGSGDTIKVLMPSWVKAAIAIDVVVSAAILAGAALVVFRVLKVHKQGNAQDNTQDNA